MPAARKTQSDPAGMPAANQAPAREPGFGSTQIRNLKPGKIREREVSCSCCSEQPGREPHRRRATGNRNHPERHTCWNAEKQRHQRDQVWISHEMLYLKIVKVPVQDRIRDVQVSGVIAVVTDKVCGLVQKKRSCPEHYQAEGQQQEQFSPP